MDDPGFTILQSLFVLPKYFINVHWYVCVIFFFFLEKHQSSASGWKNSHRLRERFHHGGNHEIRRLQGTWLGKCCQGQLQDKSNFHDGGVIDKRIHLATPMF